MEHSPARSYSRKWTLLSADKRKGPGMVQHKIGRTVNGDPAHVLIAAQFDLLVGDNRFVDHR